MKSTRSIFAAAAILAAALSFAGAAHAQTVAFQSGSNFEGGAANIALDIEDAGVSGRVVALNLVANPSTGNFEGAGTFRLQANGISIDDPAARYVVVGSSPSGAPTCSSARQHYITGIVVAGSSGGVPYAFASTFNSFVPGGECPVEWLQFEGAVGAAFHSLKVSSFDPRVQLALKAAQRHEASFGAVKSLFR